MSSNEINHSRRTFVKTGIAGIAGLQLVVLGGDALASDLPRLSEDDTTAKALGYVHDATTVSEQERGAADRNCANCRFWTAGDEPWGPCALFPGKAVAREGWCKGWVAR